MSLQNLTEYSKSFQLKVLANLLIDCDFLAQIFDALRDDLFESDALNAITKMIKEYYVQYKATPPMEAIGEMLKSIKNDVMRYAVKESLKDIYQNILPNATDLDYVKDEFNHFCVIQELKAAVIDSVDLIQKNDADVQDVVKSRMDKAFKAYQKKDLGHNYEESVKERLTQHLRKGVVPTEWPVINDIIQGGPGEGDLCVLVGASGAMKSWSLVSIGLHALKQGKNVVHFTLELNEIYTAKRYDSKLTGIPSQDLFFHVNEVIEAVESNVKGKLRIFFHPTKSATVLTLRRQLDLLIAYGFRPDLVIVDYADLLRNDNINHQKGGSYAEVGSIYEDMRGLAGEYKVPCWSASQSHRAAADSEIITGEQIAESYKKVMISDFVISIARRMEDKLGGTARWHIIKNRYGPDGQTFPSKVDASVGKIEIFPMTSEKGVALAKEMKKSGELRIKKLSESYRQTKDDDKKNLDGFENNTPEVPVEPTDPIDAASEESPSEE